MKMKELGVSSHPDYKLCFMLDSSAMISVHTPKYGVIEVSSASPLAISTYTSMFNFETKDFVLLFTNTVYSECETLVSSSLAERHSAKNRSDRGIVDTSMKLGTQTLQTILINF